MEKVVCTFALLLFAFSGVSAGQREHFGLPDSAMAGHWQGTGREIMSWSQKDTIRFDLRISPDGSVSGTIGDARIREGKVMLNNPFLRWLGNSPYLIKAKLDGEIVSEEGIRRKGITLVLRFENDRFTGGFRTSGWEFGGKKRMAMTGIELVLKRAGKAE